MIEIKGKRRICDQVEVLRRKKRQKGNRVVTIESNNVMKFKVERLENVWPVMKQKGTHYSCDVLKRRPTSS